MVLCTFSIAYCTQNVCQTCNVYISLSLFFFLLCLADAVHNAAGYGIKGLNEKGEVSWDLISNIHIWKIEARERQ